MCCGSCPSSVIALTERAPIEPMVSIIIAAHNEAAGISKKILNCLELTYPNDKYEIFVASDGSD